VRDLARPEILKPTACAALASALLCLPRLLMWSHRSYPVWYLDAIIFTGGFVLWAFVFAWHTKYTGRPVFTWNISVGDFFTVALAGIIVAAVLRWFVDPMAQPTMPEDYPANLPQWLAMCLFTLGLDQLFVVCAPYAWLIRLFQNRRMALILTALFSLVVLLLKLQRARSPVAPTLFIVLMISRLVGTTVSVVIYLRGGLLLAWWWGFLVELHGLPV
jgi:hypothetical protein